MAIVGEVFWRQVTDADFVCVERPKGLKGGGGQTYFSLSFGQHLDKAAFGRFLGVDPPTLIATQKPSVSIKAAVLTDLGQVETIEFSPRYKNDSDDRYRIANQNRQRASQVRHPAWTAARGFPEAPDDIEKKDDPRMPDLSHLKLIVVRDEDGLYFADYVNSSVLPNSAPAALSLLFEPNRDVGADGLISLASAGISVGQLAEFIGASHESSSEGRPTSVEIEDAIDATARSAGARSRRGQGYRQSAEERTAIDRHAMSTAIEHLERDGWQVTDKSINHPYDLLCERDGQALRVEVKGTTGDGTAVLLTPNEVAHAREQFPAIALFIVYDIAIVTESDGSVAITEVGETELVEPWEIDAEGQLFATGFSYVRNFPA